MATKMVIFAEVCFILSKVPLNHSYMYTSKVTSFSIPFYHLFFFSFEIVPEDISERTALISVNPPRSELFVQKHVTVQFAITF